MSPLPEGEIPAVVCKGLSKSFGDVDALRGLTLLAAAVFIRRQA